MSTTESTAITRLINDAQRLSAEPEQPRRIAKGTVAPVPPQPAPPPVAMRAPSQGHSHDAWFVESRELLLEDDDEDAGGEDIDFEDEETPAAGAAQAARVQPAAAPRPAPARPSIAMPAVAAPRPAPEPIRPTPQITYTGDTDFLDEAPRSRKGLVWVGIVAGVIGGMLLGVVGAKKIIERRDAKAAASSAATEEETPAPAAAPAPAPAAQPVTAAAPAATPEPSAAAAPEAAPEAAAAPETAAATAPIAATATLELPGVPADTTVFLDGRELGAGPMRVSQLVPGPHDLTLVAADGSRREHKVELLSDGTTRFDASISPEAAAEAAADTAAAAAAAEEPAAPAEEPTIAPVEPKRAAKAPRDRSAKRERRAKKEKAVAAAPAKPPAGQGFLLVNAKPPCEIFVDGQRTGKTTPQRNLALPAGKRTILLVNAEHRIKKVTTVTIEKGKSARLVLDLTDEMK